MYYILKNMEKDLSELRTGAAQPHIYPQNLKKIKIPVPILKTQIELVAFCDKTKKEIMLLEDQISAKKASELSYILNFYKI